MPGQPVARSVKARSAWESKSPQRRWPSPPSQDGDTQQACPQSEETRSAWEKSLARNLGSVPEIAKSLTELRKELRSQGQQRSIGADPQRLIEAVKSCIAEANDRMELKIERTLQGMNQHLTERLEVITGRIEEHQQHSRALADSASLQPPAASGGDPLTEFDEHEEELQRQVSAPTETMNVIPIDFHEHHTPGTEHGIQTLMQGDFKAFFDDDLERLWSYLYFGYFWLVVLSVIWIGVSLIVSLPSARRGEQPPQWLFFGDIAVVVVFWIELLMRFALVRRSFFTGPWRGWNAFDTVITVCGLLTLFDLVPRLVSLLRVIKGIYLLRTFRLLRSRTLRGLREARIVIHIPWKPCLWGFWLMFSLSYIFAVVVSQSVTDWLNVLNDSGSDHAMRKHVELHYGTFQRTWYTILLASAHGASWTELREPLEYIGWWLPPIFLAYIMVMNLVVLNIITALYVDAVSYMSSFDRALRKTETAQEHGGLIEGDLKPLLKQADVNQDGRIDRAAMIMVLGRKQGVEVLSDLKLDMASMKALFKLMDAEELGSVSIEDFCAAVTYLKGSNLHTAMLLFQSRRMLVRLDRLGRSTESRLHSLKGLIQSAASNKERSFGLRVL